MTTPNGHDPEVGSAIDREAETAPIPADEALDWQALRGWLRTKLEIPDRPFEVVQFTAGHSNLTYLVTIGELRLVVRRPPRGTIAPGAHDMVREAKVLSRLFEAYPRAPRCLALCEDDHVIGAPFLVTEYRTGEVVRTRVPESMVGLDHVIERLDRAVVDATADLHSVDPYAVGLGDLGRPDGFAQRQVSGWTDRWHRAAPDPGVRLMDDLATRLADSIPTPQRITIVHNDLKMDNCQFPPDDPDTVTSVFDWDMATLGDPLFDLALLLTSMGSNPLWTISTDEVVERYSTRSGIDVESFDWYRAFATWRTGVVIQQLANRHRSGDSNDERLSGLDQLVPTMAERGLSILES